MGGACGLFGRSWAHPMENLETEFPSHIEGNQISHSGFAHGSTRSWNLPFKRLGNPVLSLFHCNLGNSKLEEIPTIQSWNYRMITDGKDLLDQQTQHHTHIPYTTSTGMVIPFSGNEDSTLSMKKLLLKSQPSPCSTQGCFNVD